MSGKMKDNPGSGRIQNLLIGVFIDGGTRPPPPPNRPSNFCSEHIVWHQIVAEQRPDTATAALSSCSSVKFPNVYRLLTTIGTLPETTSQSERVFSKLQRTLTSIRSTMTEDRLEALLLLQYATASTVLRYARRAHAAHFARKPDVSTSFCSRNC